MSLIVNFAARSDVGLVRSSNQDSGYAGPHLLVLADGMGGPAGGDIASSVAVAHLVHLDEEQPAADDLLPSLREAVTAAHADLEERAEADPELAGLGTTCIAVLRSENKVAMVHIGDSRAYLLRDGVLIQVTTDHTFVVNLGKTAAVNMLLYKKTLSILEVVSIMESVGQHFYVTSDTTNPYFSPIRFTC